MLNVMLMEELKNKEVVAFEKVEKVTIIEHPECNRTVQGRKVTLTKKKEKTYTVIVRYIQIPGSEAKIKRSIIESILKKGQL